MGRFVAKHKFFIAIPEPAMPYARRWLQLGVGALALAGIFAVLLVLARTPGIQNLLPYQDFFNTALVTHVTLSVLVWLLSMQCLLWHVVSYHICSIYSRAAFWLAALGTGLMAVTPFLVGDARPLLANYIPVLNHPLFFAGLSFFACGVIFQAALAVISFVQFLITRQSGAVYPLGIGAYSTAIITLVAITCFIISQVQMTDMRASTLMDAAQFYDLLFWGGGHILQYAYAAIMVVGWLWLADQLSFKIMPHAKFIAMLFLLHALIAMAGLMAYRQPILSFEHMHFFTMHMAGGSSLLAFVAGLYLLPGSLKKEAPSALYNALVTSLLLFAAGGIISLFIEGSDTRVPAHYHGVIVAVSISLMGLAYYLLPHLGFREVGGRWARIQPILYGGGQLLHIIGLAWSGGYGALRKTPGAVHSIEGQAAMGLMGLGGLISIIGGLIFVVLMLKAFRK